MGTGYGEYCVRCKVRQLRYENGYDHERELCDQCVMDLNKIEYDKEHGIKPI